MQPSLTENECLLSPSLSVHSILSDGRVFYIATSVALSFLSGHVHLVRNNLALDNQGPDVPVWNNTSGLCDTSGYKVYLIQL